MGDAFSVPFILSWANLMEKDFRLKKLNAKEEVEFHKKEINAIMWLYKTRSLSQAFYSNHVLQEGGGPDPKQTFLF